MMLTHHGNKMNHTLKQIDHALEGIKTAFERDKYLTAEAPRKDTAVEVYSDATGLNARIKIGKTHAVISKEGDLGELCVSYQSQKYIVNTSQSNFWRFKYSAGTREWGGNDQMLIDCIFNKEMTFIPCDVDTIDQDRFCRTYDTTSKEIQKILTEYRQNSSSFITDAQIDSENLIVFFYDRIGDEAASFRLFKAQFKIETEASDL